VDRLLIGAFYLTNFLRIDVDLKERDKTASREHHEEGHFVFSLVGGVGFNGFVLELVGPEGREPSENRRAALAASPGSASHHEAESGRRGGAA